ncbi:MAG TPA: tetratricopeptide repeat protein [Polyangiales bacterium]|nr:tetratricopeptide repeat protein [Polyangiales bacterium]
MGPTSTPDLVPNHAALCAKGRCFLAIDRTEWRQVKKYIVRAIRLLSIGRCNTWRSCATIVLALCSLPYAAACSVGLSSEDVEKSMKQYELAVGLQQEGNKAGAFKSLYKAVEINPYNARAHLLLGKLFLLNRDDNPAEFDRKAEFHLRQVLAIQSGEYRSEETQAAVAEAHNDLGVLLNHQGHFRKAVPEFEAAIADLFNREAHMAWGNLGWSYLELRDYPKAIDALSRAVKLRRDFCVGHFRLGKAFSALKDYEKAEQAFTNAIEADARCAGFQHAWHERGLARMSLGNREDARADFEHCVELGPKSDEGTACSRNLEAIY